MGNLVRRALAAGVAAALAAGMLTGCVQQAGLKQETLDAAFDGKGGVLGVPSACSQNLPGYFDCTMWVVMDPASSAAELEDALAIVHEVVGPHEAYLVFDTEVKDVRFLFQPPFNAHVGPSGLSDSEVAAGVRAGLALDGAEDFHVGQATSSASSSLPRAGTAELVVAAQSLIAAMPGVGLRLEGDSVRLAVGGGVLPEPELAVLTAVEDAFPVVGAYVSSGFLQVQILPGSDASLAAAKEFAAALPEYAAIDTVLITDDDTDYSALEPAERALVVPVVEQAKQLPEYVSSEVSAGAIDFEIADAADAGAMDAALADAPGYSDLAIGYDLGFSTVFRAPGAELLAGVFASLLNHGFERVLIHCSPGGGPSCLVSIESSNESDPEVLGRWLGESGLAEIEGSRVQLEVDDSATEYFASMIVGPELDFGDGDEVSDGEKAALQSGWSEGIASR